MLLTVFFSHVKGFWFFLFLLFFCILFFINILLPLDFKPAKPSGPEKNDPVVTVQCPRQGHTASHRLGIFQTLDIREIKNQWSMPGYKAGYSSSLAPDWRTREGCD